MFAFVVLAAASVTNVNYLSLYEHSPVVLHRQLRQAFLKDNRVAAPLRSFVEATGDHSFDAFFSRTEAGLEALRLQRKGWENWDAGRFSQAKAQYRTASSRHQQSRMRTEAVFCLFYIAAIELRLNRAAEALGIVGEARTLLGDLKAPYLEALLLEKRGAALWQLDDLPAAIRAFGGALEHWRRIGYHDGLIGAWNNLASLYQELEIWKRSDHCYRQALSYIGPATLHEVAFSLYSNYAFFLLHQSRPDEAGRMARKAAEFKDVAPFHYALLEAAITGDIASFEALSDPNPELAVQRKTLLAGLRADRGEHSAARRHYLEALGIARRHDLRLWYRRVMVLYCTLLEDLQQFRQAGDLYLKTFLQNITRRKIDTVLPYGRVLSPLFDGWVRCLIRQGKIAHARKAIHWGANLRRQKALELINSLPPLKTGRGEIDQFVELTKLADQQLSEPAPRPFAARAGTAGRTATSTVEIWPSRDSIFVWVDTDRSTHFVDVEFSHFTKTSLDRVLDRLYSGANGLPPAPRTVDLRTLFNSIFAPIEPLLGPNHVLIIPHGDLEGLPFEVLLDPDGRYLLDRYNFSYLPSPLRAGPSPLSRRSPILLVPDHFRSRSGSETEIEELSRLFPNLRKLATLKGDFPIFADWIHISTHLRLDPNFWLAATLDGSDGELHLMDLLRRKVKSRFLSLGVCDSANSEFSYSPYWLGFGELFLARGIPALMMSRWRLDELSTRIFVDFYRYSRQGFSLDAALSKARRDFLSLQLERDGRAVSGSHPYFWAGLTYIGQPGYRLYDKPSSRPWWALFLGLTALAGIIHRLLSQGAGPFRPET